MRWGLIVSALLSVLAGACSADESGAEERAAKPRGAIAYVAKIGGSSRVRIRPLAGGPSHDVAPGTGIQGWSVDGSELVFYSDVGKYRDVFVAKANGSTSRRIARVSGPTFALSPDRRSLAVANSDCTRARSLTIRIQDLRGATRATFRTMPRGGSVDLFWSPTNLEVAYVHSWLEDEPCRGLAPSSDLYRASLSAPAASPVETRGWVESVTYSPAGDLLAFSDECGVDPPICEDLHISSGGRVRSVAPAGVIVDSGAFWSTDGDDLFVVLADAPRAPDYVPRRPRLVAIDVGSAQVRPIALLPDWLVVLEAVSRDDSQLIIRGFSPERMWIVPAAGGPLRQLPWPPSGGFEEGSEAIFLR